MSAYLVSGLTDCSDLSHNVMHSLTVILYTYPHASYAISSLNTHNQSINQLKMIIVTCIGTCTALHFKLASYTVHCLEGSVGVTVAM